MIHDEPLAIADRIEALADEETLTENLKLQLNVFPNLQGADGSFIVIWKIVMVYQLVHVDLK